MKLMDSAAVRRLEEYFGAIGQLLGNDSRRGSFATYALGLLSEGERKSVEPMSARACASVKRGDAAHQRLLHFVSTANWSDQDIRRFAGWYALQMMTEREKVETWVIDDTGFLKQGKHSVGVQRQYTGSAGKVTNCQLGVSLTVTTLTEHLPIDFELYLPTSWTDDPERRKEARIPDEVAFKTKPELALEMVRRAVANGVPPGVVLADSAYGTSGEFRAGVRQLGLHYAVAVDPRTTVNQLSKGGRLNANSVSVKDLATTLNANGGFRRCTWRKGTKDDLTARFAMVRVIPCRDSAKEGEPEPAWLLIEWRDDESEPANYFLSSLPPTTRKKPLIRLVMQRWRTERAYEDLKGELGLDHYEGRRFQGWHHHVSVVLCCYAFVVSERVRHFPPSARGTKANHPQSLTTRTALPRQLHHRPTGDRSHHRHVAPQVSLLSSRAKSPPGSVIHSSSMTQ